MAEPKKEYIERICPLFCDRYNKDNNTNFIFDKIAENQCDDVDFYIKDGANKLPIQYSIIENTPQFIKSSHQTAVVTEKLEQMGNAYRLKCNVSIRFSNVPISNNDIDQFVRCFMIFLSSHLRSGIFKPRFKRDYDAKTITGILKYLSEFEIISTGNSKFGLLIGNEAWEFGGPVVENAEYYLNQILEKDSIYAPNNNLILLFDVNPMPVIGATLDELRKKCNSIEFNCKEIWQINTGNSGYCDKLYPYATYR
jgi:hypothetical protein